VRADQVDARAAEDDLRDQRVLPALERGDGDAFAQWPEAIATTLEIAERCDVEIELGKQLIPRYPPDGREREYLRELVHGGPARRYGDPPPAEALERAEYELG
jgi:DNA polymerase-3 subunit alpha